MRFTSRLEGNAAASCPVVTKNVTMKWERADAKRMPQRTTHLLLRDIAWGTHDSMLFCSGRTALAGVIEFA